MAKFYLYLSCFRTYPSVPNTEVSSSQEVGVEDFNVYRGVLISGGWNRAVPLYTEVSLFQGVGTERFIILLTKHVAVNLPGLQT